MADTNLPEEALCTIQLYDNDDLIVNSMVLYF